MSAVEGGREGVALLVGINAYVSDRIWPLTYASADATALRDALVDPDVGGFPADRVKLLTDAGATRAEVVGTLSKWLPEASAGAEVAFVYFAGHGMTYGIGDRKEGFLLPHDADPDNPIALGVAMGDILRWMDNVRAGAVVLCFDCCHAGKAIPRHAGPTDPAARRLSVGPEVIRKIAGKGRFLLASCDEGQYSHELPSLRHGLFTHHLLEGIRGKGDRDGDGRVGVTELFDYVSEAVESDSRALLGVEQKPWINVTTAGRVYLSSPGRRPPAGSTLFPPKPPRAGQAVPEAVRAFDLAFLSGDEQELRRGLHRAPGSDDPAWVSRVFRCLAHPAEGVRDHAKQVIDRTGWDATADAIEGLARRRDDEAMGFVLDGLDAFSAHPAVVERIDRLVDLLEGNLLHRATRLLADKSLKLRLAETAALFEEERSDYRIDDSLGQGPLTAAYLAFDKVNEIPVVVRVLHPRFVGERAIRSAFRDLGKACVPLVHQNLIWTRGVGSFPARGIHFIVRMYVEGVTLQKALEQGAAFEPSQALAVLRQVADALKPLHEAGITHGAVRPSNVFLTKGRRAVLGDPTVPTAGVALALDRLSYDYRYAPPEAFRPGGALVPQSDFYSLGCVAYELFCGSPPFVSESHHDLVAEHKGGRIDPPSRRRSALGRAGDEFVLKLLSRSPSARPADVDAVLREMAALDSALRERVGRGPGPDPDADGAETFGANVRYDDAQSMVGFEPKGDVSGLGRVGPEGTGVPETPNPATGAPIVLPPPPPRTNAPGTPGGEQKRRPEPPPQAKRSSVLEGTGGGDSGPEGPPGDARTQATGFPVHLDFGVFKENVDDRGALGVDESDPVEIHPGRVILGKYRVLRMIGQGGMGSVWLVEHIQLHTERALKAIRPEFVRDSDLRARFVREAQVMARFSHPNAVTVHDAVIAGDLAVIDMEYVPGQSLQQLLVKGTPMPLDWTARVVDQLCDVLGEAHRRGIVHRDLKPSNLMLLDGRPPGAEHLKVLDFGIAKILDPKPGDRDDFSTQRGGFVGTPQYASPEQILGNDVDGRSDLYSVGVVLYELLTGYRPFQGTGVKVLGEHMNSPPPPFATVNPAVVVPAAVERLVLQCLAKDPDDRPSSARLLRDVFREAVDRHQRLSSFRGQKLFRPVDDPLPAPATRVLVSLVVVLLSIVSIVHLWYLVLKR